MKRPANGRFPAVHAYGPEAHGMSKQRTVCQSYMAIGATAPEMTTDPLKVTCGQCLRRTTVLRPPKKIEMNLFDSHNLDSGSVE